MSAATYSTAIAFTANQLDGIFKIGVSTLDGPEVLGHEFNLQFNGPYDNVTDDCKSFHIRRGRPSQLQTIQAGNSEMMLLNKNRKYDPLYTGSPIYPNIRPMRPCQIRAFVLGGPGPDIDHALYTGFTAEINGNPDWGAQEAVFTFEDLYLWMERNDGPVISSTGSTTVGAAIGLVLDAVGWTNPTLRQLAVGSTIPDFSADGSKSALSCIDELLAVDRGLFYANKEGVAVYEDRYAKELRPSSFTLVANSLARPGVSVRDIFNRARVTREGGTTQTHTDTVSRNEFGLADAGEINTPYLATDADALYLAKYLVHRSKDPQPLYWEIEVTEATEDLDNLLGLDLFDRITITASPGPSAVGSDYHVEQIEHWGEGATLHRSKWTLSQRVHAVGFRIDVSELDGPDVITY